MSQNGAAESIPWVPSGIRTIYGVILNDGDTLARYGTALEADPYKGLPKAPVLYFKPANTIAQSGDDVVLPAGADMAEVYGTVGIVLGRPACKVSEHEALACVRGYIAAMDLTLPHDSLYRPPIREKCFDGSLPLGTAIASCEQVPDPSRLTVEVSVNGMVMQRWRLSQLVRSIPKLIADVSAFMTLSPGDVLLAGIVAGAPRARLGDLAAVAIPGVGSVEARIGGAIP